MEAVEHFISAGAQAGFVGLHAGEHGAERLGVEDRRFVGFLHTALDGGAGTGEGAIGDLRDALGSAGASATIDVPMAVGHGMRFGAGGGDIEQSLHAGSVVHPRVIDAVRAELAEEAVIVGGDSLADHGDAEAVRGQGGIGRGGRHLAHILHGGSAEGIDLMGGPQVRGELFGEDGGVVYPVGLVEFAGQFETA